MTTAENLGITGLEDVERLDIDGWKVFRARQPDHVRQVVVKVLDPLQEPLLPRRFDPRRKALNRFTAGPGVVAVHESGTTAHGQPYLMMPYFRIGSLGDQLGHGPMPWHRASELIVKAAEIVGRGHDLGVVLGDLRPTNILLADASSPLIAVYGMARRRFDDGSPTYRAPEALPGADLLPAADVYSLSLVLAAVIAGRPPNRCGPSTEFRGQVAALAPERILDVIDRGLAESPRLRYVNARQFAVALSGAVEEPVPAGRSDDDTDFDLDEILGPPTAELVLPRLSDIDLVEPETEGWGRPDPTELAGPSADHRGRGVGDHLPVAASWPRNRRASAAGSGNAGGLAGGPRNAAAHVDGVEGFADTAAGIVLEWRDEDSFLDDGTHPSTGVAAPADPTTAGDEDLPFRAFDRQRVPDVSSGHLAGLNEVAQNLWFSGRRSLGGVLAVVSFAAIAVIIGLLVYRDLRGTDHEPGLGLSTTTSAAVADRVAGPVVMATEDMSPVPPEPPPTHRTSTTLRPTTSTTAGTGAPASTVAAPLDPAPPPTGAPTTATSAPTPTAEPTTTLPSPSLGPAGPTEPVIDAFDVSRVRATSARLTVSSASCVSVTFAYGPAGESRGQTSSNGCSQAHTLLLGVVTPALQPGTTYQVSATATDPSGATASRQLSFTTQG